MATGQPAEAPVRQAGGGGARLHRARQRGSGRGQRPGRPDRPGAGPRCAAPGRVFRLLADLSAIEPADGPTDLVAAARHAAAQLHGRGVVILISDLLDPAADKVIRELAATGSELIVLHVLSPEELDPALEGDLRLVDVETGDGVDVTVDLATLDAYKARLAAWKAGLRRPRGQAPGELRRPVVRHEPRRPDVRRAPPPARAGVGRRCRSPRPWRCSACCSSRPSSRCTCSSCAATRPSSPRRCCGPGSIADVEANAPWQRLRRSLLLLLQLLLVAILALLAARPFLERPAGLARDIVLVIDTSASMAATDVSPNRLEAAKAAAIDALRDLPTGGRVSVIAADRTARIVVNETTDLGRVRQALDGIEPTSASGDLGDALELAGKLAARSGDAQILVATDGALATPPTASVDAPITVLPGRPRPQEPGDRRARGPDGAVGGHPVGLRQRREPRPRAADRRLELWGDGGLLEVRDLVLDPQARSDVVIDDVPRDVGRSRSGSSAPNPAVAGAPDHLAVDDRAWAIIPPDRTRLILLVGEGDPYLETALSYLPNVELYGVTPAEYGPATERTDGRPWDLVIFEGTLPATLPRTPILAIAPAATSPSARSPARSRTPGIGSLSPDEPILRYVDLSTTHIADGVALRPARLGADGHPGPERRAAAVRRGRGPACRPRSWPSSRGAPTCRSRSPSRSSWRT